MDRENMYTSHKRAIIKHDNEALFRAINITIVMDNSLLVFAIHIGNVDALKLLLDNGCLRYLDRRCFIDAAIVGHIESIQLLLNYGFSSYEGVMKEVYLSGNLDIIKIFDDNLWIKGTREMKWVVKSFNMDAISHLIDLGCPYGFMALKAAVKYSSLNIIKLLHHRGIYVEDDKKELDDIYSYVNDINIMTYLYEVMHIDWNLNSLCDIVQKMNINIVIYALDNLCPVPNDIDEMILEIGDLEILKLFHEREYPIYQNYDINYMKESIVDYYHNNILNRNFCQKGCLRCRKYKEMTIRTLWIMEEMRFNNIVQWMPLEVLEDILAL